MRLKEALGHRLSRWWKNSQKWKTTNFRACNMRLGVYSFSVKADYEQLRRAGRNPPPGDMQQAVAESQLGRLTIMLLRRLRKFALLAIRVTIGLVLFYCTALLAGVIGQFAFERDVPFGTRSVLFLVSLFFALQACMIYRILIFRRRARGTGSDFKPPGSPPPPGWPIGVPVPVRPPGPWLLRAASQPLPHET